MNIKEIKEILGLMKEHGLSNVEIEKDGLKIKLSKDNLEGMVAQVPVQAPVAVPAAPSAAPASAADAGNAGASVTPVDDANVTVVKSPMVGSFYAAPAPDQPPFAAVGQTVKKGDVLCILEAMKLMNEIKSDVNGVIEEILVQNGQPVEFDQPLFKIKTS